MKDRKRLQELIADIAEGLKPPALFRGEYNDPLGALLLTEPYATTDFDIAKVERIESVIKLLLRDIMSGPVSGETGRLLATYQQRVGFLYKYKSYTIKCATPLGYSIFFHNKAEGFSFQRHVTHKTELFHILEVKEGGYVFVCEHDDWRRVYDASSFAAWLAGEPNDAYDRYKYTPRPGDVIVIDKLGTVHSVIGCVLEEYATASTDMVDRLYDQNAEKGIPAHFTRDYAIQQLRGLTLPRETRSVVFENGSGAARSFQLEPRGIRGGVKTRLLDSFLSASLYHVEPGTLTEFFSHAHQATIIYVSAGFGHLLLGTASEVASSTPPAVNISAGETVLIAPGLIYAFFNEGPTPLSVSEQRIHPEVPLQ